MLRHLLTMAFRHIRLQSGYVVLNVLGLSVGLASAVLSLLYVQDELAYDQYENGDRIYKLLRRQQIEGQDPVLRDGTSGLLGPTLKSELAEVEEFTRVLNSGGWFDHEGKSLRGRLCSADPAILDMFDLRLVRGKRPAPADGSALVTESAALRFFGSEDPIGKVVTSKNSWTGGTYSIVGIVEDLPPQSYGLYSFDFLTATPPANPYEWYWEVWVRDYPSALSTFVLLRPGASAASLQEKLPSLMARHMGPEFASKNSLLPQQFSRIYLYHNVDFAQPGFARIQVVYLFAAIAGFVLLLACINFTNLATARAGRRAREIGLRKAMGATRGRLMGQFLSESVFMAVVALAAGLLLAFLVLPSYNGLAGKQLSLSSLLSPSSALFLLTLTLFTGLLAGTYPALFVSAFNPVAVLKGGAVIPGGKKSLMRVLVVCQFTIATALISTTIVVRDQIEFVSNKRLGFDSEHVYVLPVYALSKRIDRPRIRDYNAWKRLFLEHPDILAGSASQTLIGWGGMLHAVFPEGYERDTMQMWIMGVDEDFLDVHDIPLVAGRFISEADTTNAYVLNETAVKSLGWDDPLGKGFGWHKNRNGVVVGVVKDFHSHSLHEPISPVVLTKWTSSNNNLSLRISGERIPETLDFIKEVWLKIHPDKPFDGWFLDDTIDSLYANEAALARTARMSAALAVFVACLGLFGLSSFAAQQRLREIAIRKVLGASSTFLVYLVSREFLLLVLVANIVALPVVHVLMTEWLNNFAYHAGLATGPFATSCFLSVGIAVATVSFHAVRGAWLNPAETLRDE